MPFDRSVPKLQLTDPSAVFDGCKLRLGLFGGEG